VKRYRRLRRLQPDAALVSRRAAGESLRALAREYGVSHTTLSRYFARPQVAKELREAARLPRGERHPGTAHAELAATRLRRLIPDPELYRRRAAGEALRALASDYDVSHTTLGRYFARPQAARLLRAERRAQAARRSAERRFAREVRRKAREQAAFERELLAARRARTANRRSARSAYAAWLDARDARLPLSRSDLYSTNDHLAARVVASGGGIEQVLEATGLRTRDNLLGLIDPALLARALDNDAVCATVVKAAS
jgi:lambda repressor-like predicted transcriptional regulator